MRNYPSLKLLFLKTVPSERFKRSVTHAQRTACSHLFSAQHTCCTHASIWYKERAITLSFSRSLVLGVYSMACDIPDHYAYFHCYVNFQLVLAQPSDQLQIHLNSCINWNLKGQRWSQSTSMLMAHHTWDLNATVLSMRTFNELRTTPATGEHAVW